MYVTVWDVPGREQWGRPRTAECREWQNEYFSKKNIFLPSADIKVMTKITFSTTNDGDGARCWWRSWLRHCATCRKVAGSIPDGAIGIFHWHNPSGHTITLGLIQPLTEMSTRNISWGGKGGRCVALTTLPHSCADCLEIWEPQPAGTLRACPGL